MKDLIGNADGSTFTVGYGMKVTKVAKILQEDVKPDQSIKVAPGGDPVTGLFTIKMYTMMWANGFMCPPIFIIESKSLKRGTLDKYKVPGLGFGVDPASNYGWLIFTDDRSLSKDFYE